MRKSKKFSAKRVLRERAVPLPKTKFRARTPTLPPPSQTSVWAPRVAARLEHRRVEGKRNK